MTQQLDFYEDLTAKAEQMRKHARKMERVARKLQLAKEEELKAVIKELREQHDEALLVCADALLTIKNTVSRNGTDAAQKIAVRKRLSKVLERRVA